jgi:hypothetical protein
MNMTTMLKGRILSAKAELIMPTIGPAPVSPAVLRVRARSPIEYRFDLAGVVISMAAADDFGSVKIADFQNTNLKIEAAIIDAVFSVAGLATNTGVSVDFAIGSAATITTTFATAGEAERLYMNKLDGVGAAATGGTVKGHSFDNATAATLNAGTSMLPILLDAHATANDLYLNASSPVTSGTGTITFTAGGLSIFVADFSEPS